MDSNTCRLSKFYYYRHAVQSIRYMLRIVGSISYTFIGMLPNQFIICYYCSVLRAACCLLRALPRCFAEPAADFGK